MLKKLQKVARIFTFLGICAAVFIFFIIITSKLDPAMSMRYRADYFRKTTTIYIAVPLFLLMFVIDFFFVLAIELERISRKRQKTLIKLVGSKKLARVLRLIFAFCTGIIFILFIILLVVWGEDAVIVLLLLPYLCPLAIIVVAYGIKINPAAKIRLRAEKSQPISD